MAYYKKFIPGSDADSEDIFKYPYFDDKETKEYIENHGKIMFIVRGPPGTGKKTLSDMFLRHYPSGVKCCADNYFTEAFSSSVRDRDNLKKSHEYCQRKAKQECMKGTNPVIVTNTHMKKCEMQEYLNYAEEYGYTIIMSITTDKFKISSKILAKSNNKGLSKEYFDKRLKQWEDVFPILTGWFLDIGDTYSILNDVKSVLDALLADGKFCRVFNAYDKGELFKIFQAKEVLFCIAGYSNSTPFELKNYYKSAQVKESYGKCFTVHIQAYIITKSDIFAAVQMDDALSHLRFEPQSETAVCAEENYDDDSDSMNHVTGVFQSLSVQNSYNFKTIPLCNEIEEKSKNLSFRKWENSDSININKVSFIHVAQQGKAPFSVCKISKLFKKCLLNISQPSGELALDQFYELDSGYKICRLSNNTWLVKVPEIISVKTVFTGLYI